MTEMPSNSQSPSSLVHTSISVNRECEEVVITKIEEIAGFPPSVYATPESERVTISIYQEPGCPEMIDPEELQAFTENLTSFGLNPGEIECDQAITEKKDWADVWKSHFHVIRVLDRIVIRPSWEPAPADPGLIDVVLDPGLSFGTGHHETTRYCLQQIISLMKDGHPINNFLDAGTGSGILSIAAAKLGIQNVTAFDYDSEAVNCTQQNAADNNTSFLVFQADLEKNIPQLEPLPQEFDLVVANILAETLEKYPKKLNSWIKPKGFLILAGILIAQYPNIKNTFENHGFREIHSEADHEWQSGTFQKL